MVAMLAMLGAPLVGCGRGEDENERSDIAAVSFGGGSAPQPPTSPEKAPLPPDRTNPTASQAAMIATDVDPATTTHPEVVQLVMKGNDGWTWFCTATLVSSTVAVTAAHCLQSKLFASWTIIAASNSDGEQRENV
jgi:hypothetical protein